MSPRRRSTSSVSTLQIVGVVVVLLVVGVVLAVMLAPSKPEAPPPSEISYKSPPERTQPSRPGGSIPNNAPAHPPKKDAVPPETAPPALPEPEEQQKYAVHVEVVDSKTGDPISGAEVFLRRKWSDTEQKDWKDRESAAIRAKDTEAVMALDEERKRFQKNHHWTTGRDGTIEEKLALGGLYAVRVRQTGYVTPPETERTLDESQTSLEVLLKLSSGASVTGRVVEAGSLTPVDNVTIQVVPEEHIRENGFYLASKAWPKTDEQGNYQMKGLVPGEYSVSVNLSEVPYQAGKVLPYQRITVAHPDQEIRGVDFKLDPAGIVWGYVLSTDQEPISGVDVVLCTSKSVLSQALTHFVKQAPPMSDRSEKDGYYELVGVPLNEEWRLYATSEKSAPQLADPFLLTVSQRFVRIDLYVYDGTTVYGRVLDSDYKPIKGAQVMCLPSYSKLVSPLDTPAAFRETRSKEDGAYQLKEVPGGNYQIFAHKEGYKIAASGTPIYPNGHTDLSGIDLILDPVDEGEYAVFGTVTDMTEQPVSGAKVQLEGMSTVSFNNFARETSTGFNGEYVIDGVPTGMYQLRVFKEGYAATTVNRVLLDKPTDVVLGASSVIRGTVLVQGTNQPPKNGYTVTATPLTSLESGSLNFFAMGEGGMSGSFSAPDGSFELTVRPGAYRIEASANSLTPERTEVAVEAGEVVATDTLYLSQEGGVIAGRVTTGDGKSPQGAQVLLVEAGSSAEAAMMATFAGELGGQTTTVGSDGIYSFESLPTGSYSVVARHTSYAAADSGLLELEAGGQLTGIDLRLGTGGALEGYVYQHGNASAGAVVMVTGQGTTQTATADNSGYYYVDGLSSGMYQAVVAPVGSGDLTAVYSTRGAPVEITEGRTTRYDFGTGDGITIEGRCMPGPRTLAGGRVAVNVPGTHIGALGEPVSTSVALSGVSSGIGMDGSFSLENVPPGDWQIDLLYFEQFPDMTLRYVHTELVSVTGEQAIVSLNLNVQF